MIAKYSKSLFKPAVRDTSHTKLSRPWEITSYTWLTFIPWADLKRNFFLFNAKTQLANSSSDQGGDKRHNKEVNGRMHNRAAKIADLVGKHLQTNEKKNQNENGRVGAVSRKRKE